jgi:hypothetical protein
MFTFFSRPFDDRPRLEARESEAVSHCSTAMLSAHHYT